MTNNNFKKEYLTKIIFSLKTKLCGTICLNMMIKELLINKVLINKMLKDTVNDLQFNYIVDH